MIPFAFDLISTFVMGSTLPVATTDRVIVPTSAVATFEGSTAGVAPRSVETPQAPATSTPATPPNRATLRDLFMSPSSVSERGHAPWMP